MPTSSKLIYFPIALSLLLGLSQADPATAVQGEKGPDGAMVLAANPASDALFDQAIAMAKAIPDEPGQIQALTTIAGRLQAVNQPRRAKQIIDQVMQIAYRIPVAPNRQRHEIFSDEKTFIAISAQVAEAGFVDRALALVKSRISIKLNKGIAFNDIAVAAARQGKTQQAQELLDQAVRSVKGDGEDYFYMGNGGCGDDKVQALSSIAQSFGLVSQLEKALKLTETFWGCSSASGDSTESYQATAYQGIVEQVGSIEAVKTIWASAKRMPQAPKISPNPIERSLAWSTIAVKLVNLNEIPLALSIATEISKLEQEKNYELMGFPEVQQDGLQKIAVALAEKRKFEAALQVKALITNNAYKDEAIGSIAVQLTESGALPKALELAESISNATVKMKTKLVIVQTLNQMGMRSQAEKLLKPLIPMLTPEMSPEVVAIGQSARALELVSKLDPDKQASIILNTARQLLKIGSLEAAQKLATLPKNRTEQEQILRAIAGQKVKQGQLDQALNMVLTLEHEKLWGDPADLPTKTDLLVSITQGFAEVGQSSKALQAATAIPDVQDRVAAIVAIARK